jgi:Mg-chelatase subunit ChlD
MPRPILFLLDRSGSMETTRDDTIGGFNAFLCDQRALNPDALMTLWQFDHEVLVSYTNKPLREVEHLTYATFQPRGSTHLLDTIGEALKSNPLDEPPIVVIFTDGQENGSHKFSKAGVKEMVEQKTSDGWTFVYLGANQDSFEEAGALGISAGTTMNYDVERTPDAFRALSATVSQQM